MTGTVHCHYYMIELSRNHNRVACEVLGTTLVFCCVGICEGVGITRIMERPTAFLIGTEVASTVACTLYISK